MSTQETKAFKFEGNPISNLNKDLKEIGTGVTTLAGGIFGFEQRYPHHPHRL